MAKEPIRLYFPSSILSQYMDISVEVLQEHINKLNETLIVFDKKMLKKAVERKVDILKTVLRDHIETARMLLNFLKKNPLVDVKTSVFLEPNIAKHFVELRRKLKRKRLGSDVIIYFAKDSPIEIGLSDEVEYELSILVEDATAYFKISTSCVADRLLWTHIIYKFLFYIHDKFGDLIREYKKLYGKIGDIGLLKASRIEAIANEHKISQTRCQNFTKQITVYHPTTLDDLVYEQFPLLTKSVVFSKALLYHLTDDYFLRMFDHKIADEFREWALFELEKFEEEYRKNLERAIELMKSVYEGVNSPATWLLRKVKERGFITTLELPALADLSGFTVEDLEFALRMLCQQGKVKPDKNNPEVFWYCGDKERSDVLSATISSDERLSLRDIEEKLETKRFFLEDSEMLQDAEPNWEYLDLD